MFFKNRREAGEKLAKELESYRGKDTVVYALPRGGVVVAYEIAKHLSVPLDLVITRKIGHPMNPEYAVCVTAEDGHMVCNPLEKEQIDPEWLKNEVEKEKQEAKRRRETYLQGRESIPAEGKTAIIVDDGIATGLTILGAINELKHQNPKKIVVAIPVSPKDSAEQIRKLGVELVALDIPDLYLGAVGAYYDHFPQTEDDEVVELLNRSMNYEL